MVSFCFLTTLATAGSEMALLPAGQFRTLFRAENDPNEVAIKPLALDIHPVTNVEYLEFVRANPRWRRSQIKRLFADEPFKRFDA